MLTIEEIKKIDKLFNIYKFSLADDGESIYLPDGPASLKQLLEEKEYEYLPRWELVYYPLYLTRVIESINTECNLFSIISKEDYVVLLDEYSNEIYPVIGYFAAGGHDNAKETAIRFVLEKLS